MGILLSFLLVFTSALFLFSRRCWKIGKRNDVAAIVAVFCFAGSVMLTLVCLGVGIIMLFAPR